MAENSAISWTNHTFNPWIGCTRVSPACDGCYAAALMGGEGGRFNRAQWGGPGKGDGTRSRTKDWRKPRKWNREAANAPGHTFVFCASLADVFDNAAPMEWRRDLFELIRETPNLTWLLLTKRPSMIVKLFCEATGQLYDLHGIAKPSGWPANAALGASIEDRKRLSLNGAALAQAARALNPAFTFWSCEPLLEDLGDVAGMLPDWVITGGETDQGAHRARPADPDWYRSLRDQCERAGVPFHFKQWGEWQPKATQAASAEIIPPTYQYFPGGWVAHLGSDKDPCTLDGVKHDARPQVRRV